MSKTNGLLMNKYKPHSDNIHNNIEEGNISVISISKKDLLMNSRMNRTSKGLFLQNSIQDNKQKELVDVNTILGKNKKESIFKLSSPRWAHPKLTHIPGPAYYKPEMSPSKTSFNLNVNQQWL
jgi:hypothetical protein